MLRGRQVQLRPVEKGDLDLLLSWINDPEVMRWLVPHFPFTRAQEEEWLNRIVTSERDRVFIIETLDAKPIGEIGLHGIDSRNRTAEMGISIFEKDYWGRGHGSDAIRTLLTFAFDWMNFHLVYLRCHEDNVRAKRAYEKCGFVEEGFLRSREFRNGRYTGGYVMSVIAEEFRERFRAQGPAAPRS